MSAEYSTAILNVIAGLGMFLYGMKLMGDGLQKVAGDKMRGILETLTKTRFSALIVGIIFTGIIQSSNAATVMVVSFVNAGLMNLSQAIGVIFGANIGTTVTGQLLSLDMSKYAPVILLVGVIMVMLCSTRWSRSSVKLLSALVFYLLVWERCPLQWEP